MRETDTRGMLGLSDGSRDFPCSLFLRHYPLSLSLSLALARFVFYGDEIDTRETESGNGKPGIRIKAKKQIEKRTLRVCVLRATTEGYVFLSVIIIIVILLVALLFRHCRKMERSWIAILLRLAEVEAGSSRGRVSRSTDRNFTVIQTTRSKSI